MKKHFLCTALLALALMGVGCSPTAPAQDEATPPQSLTPPGLEQQTDEPPLIGGQTDEHGCLGPAGYSWDEEIGACIRVWEISDADTRRAATVASDYLGQQENLTVIEVLTVAGVGNFTVTFESGQQDVKQRISVTVENWTATDSKTVEFGE